MKISSSLHNIVGHSLITLCLLLLFGWNATAQIDQLLQDFNKKQIANYKTAYEEFGGQVYSPTALVPDMTKENAMKIIFVELDKNIYPVANKPGKWEPSYYNDSTNFISKRIKEPIVVKENFFQFGTSSSDTITIKYADILFDQIILKKVFVGNVTCLFEIGQHNFRSCHNDFADALYFMRYTYSIKYYGQEIENFKPVAEAYLALTEKPGISEEQRKYLKQAMVMNEEQQYQKAVLLFNKAMEINPVAYPAGYYNLALVASLAQNYPYAIFCMKKYMMLMPNAEDVRDAQDKIYEWEVHIK
jgi:tetratricopeptide (TPR) repeat protein